MRPKAPKLSELLSIRIKIIFCDLPPDRFADVNHVEDNENQLIDVIRIDLRRVANPARSFLHELIHLKLTELSETQVLRMETRMWKKFKQHERWMVYRRLFRKGWESGPIHVRVIEDKSTAKRRRR